jgi:CelD/BcsL family acetyltransferase involved in cellulose biosynthesis
MSFPATITREWIGTIAYSSRTRGSLANLRVDVLKELPKDPSVVQQWDALVIHLERPQVFYTYEWALAVDRAYHATLRPLLFLAFDAANQLCGIAALAERKDQDEVSFLCATTGDYCDFLALPEYKQAFVAAVLGELRERGIRRVTLTNLPADSDTYSAIRRLSRQHGYRCFARTAYMCAQVSMAGVPRAPGDDRLALPGKERFRRLAKAMADEGPLRLDHARTEDMALPLVPQFILAHVARFLLTGRISNLVSPERRVFLEELAKLLAKRGWLTVSRLAAGHKSLAWNYGFQFQDTWFWYQPTFDSEAEKYSPGLCLLAKLIESAAEDPAMKVVDLGLGAEEYKDRFANQNRETLYVTLRHSPVQHAREILRYQTARMVKALPPLETMLRAAISKATRLRMRMVRDGVIATLRHILRRCREWFWFEEEVFFLEWCRGTPRDSNTRLEPLTANHLAWAAMQYSNEQETLTYLLRSASRLRRGREEGFCLIDGEGALLHFAWVTAFDGFFLAELNAKVNGPSPECVMVFDCWTPSAKRGRGYYGQALASLGQQLREAGKEPWIFSAARNVASLRGLEKVGFQRRYSMVRRRVLMWQHVKAITPKLARTTAAEVSARV